MFLSLRLVFCVFLLKKVLYGGCRMRCTTVVVQVVLRPSYTLFDVRRTMIVWP